MSRALSTFRQQDAMIAPIAETAAIRRPSGSITIYRKNNKPVFGPLGDSVDEFK
jgi:hypothetical protein